MAIRSIISSSTSHQSRSTNSVENGLALRSRPLTDPNKQYSSSPTQQSEPDFFCENHGSIFLLRPASPAAHSWISDHLPEDRMTFGNAVVVEHRYIWAIVEAIQNDGLAVQA